MAGTPEETVEAAILRLAGERGPGRSICPSEAARALAGPDEKAWSRLMPAVRATAVALAKDGRLVILRKGKPADPDAFKGVYRLALPPEA